MRKPDSPSKRVRWVTIIICVVRGKVNVKRKNSPGKRKERLAYDD